MMNHNCIRIKPAGIFIGSMVRWIILLAAVLLSVSGQINVSPPQNMAAMAGSDITLNCTIDQPLPQHVVHWFEHITDVSGQEITNNNESYNEHKYRVDGYYNLVILNVTLVDGGKYSCNATTNNIVPSSNYAADVIILEDDPACSSSIDDTEDTVAENHNVTYTCEVTYGGRWPPQINWSVLENIDSAVAVVVDQSATNQSIKQSLVIMATVDMDQTSCCQCITSFKFEDRPRGVGRREPKRWRNDYSLNVPDYSYQYNASVTTVHFSPRGTVFIPDRNLETEEYLYCITSANPPPHYTFYRNDIELQSGLSDGLKLTSDMVGNDLNVTCSISHFMIDGQEGNDVICKVLTITGSLACHWGYGSRGYPTDELICVLCCDDADINESTSVAVIILSVFLSLSLITIAVLSALLVTIYCKKRKESSEQSKDADKQTTEDKTSTNAGFSGHATAAKYTSKPINPTSKNSASNEYTNDACVDYYESYDDNEYIDLENKSRDTEGQLGGDKKNKPSDRLESRKVTEDRNELKPDKAERSQGQSTQNSTAREEEGQNNEYLELQSEPVYEAMDNEQSEYYLFDEHPNV